jgi:uncharacterized protein with HEPN domain
MVGAPKLYVGHILTEIEVLESILLKNTFQTFQDDPVYYRAAVYAVQCISEASKNLPPAWLDEYPHIRWKDIRGIGNHTRHEYSHLRPFLIWDIMIEHIPALKTVMLAMQTKQTHPLLP